MGKLAKIGLYINTVKHLKPSQVFYRIWRKVGGKTRLKPGYAPSPDASKADIAAIPVLPELDFDPIFLDRFDCENLLCDKVDLLHHTEFIDWRRSWHEELSTPLWRYNLHYCEYLLPLAKSYIDSSDPRFLDKGVEIIEAWIESNPRSGGGVGWDPYTIAMRVVNWLAFYGELRGSFADCEHFVAKLNQSLAEQYVHLAMRLEKDLLANHYFEDLKALVLLACYFHDDETYALSYSLLLEQVKEQILPDGMHFELSPMYHKIILEDCLRLAATVGYRTQSGEAASIFRIHDMCDCLYSIERNTDRTPLFNDSGDNVAKSRDALLACARNNFDVTPRYKSNFPDAGYYLAEKKTDAGLVKLIFDAGRPGPEYAMGHVHCDALSFECFVDGVPWVVNSGTFAYQDASRLEYKRSLAHNTVTWDGYEQHECWAPFRTARCSVCCCTKHDEGQKTILEGVVRHYSGLTIKRTIELSAEGLLVRDASKDCMRLQSSFRYSSSCSSVPADAVSISDYAPSFGEKNSARCLTKSCSTGQLETWVLVFGGEAKETFDGRIES
ncbi:MAG: alginate lyase family protein [Coriobacteriia bacterium]|nr:alginate lyase family protein [Coriobacteriia bacterium]